MGQEETLVDMMKLLAYNQKIMSIYFYTDVIIV